MMRLGVDNLFRSRGVTDPSQRRHGETGCVIESSGDRIIGSRFCQ